jgi:hypothetical protein
LRPRSLHQDIHNIADELFVRDSFDDFLGEGNDLFEVGCNLLKKLDASVGVQFIPAEQGLESDIRLMGGGVVPQARHQAGIVPE